ncbi:hypothetical protein ACCC88_22610 [Sphingomonas sp. Sphisp140]|uniref:hypothetical protein n=1 Tax=unclassified Sphingomonas TaxID=196159 RepID=UPI0039AE9783
MPILSMRPAALACLMVMAACRPAAPAGAQADPSVHQSTSPAPPVAAADAQQVDPEKLFAENDRAIAENKRMIDALQGYAKADPDKLACLRTQCQQKLGVPYDGGGAAKIFNCIRDSW